MIKMLEELRKIFETYTKKKLPELSRDSILAADLGLSSFELFDVVCEVENHFDIEIPDRVLTTLVTVGDLVDYLEKVTK
jgi:acyl carrier protein